MKTEMFLLDGEINCRKRARELLARGGEPGVRRVWLLLVDEASSSKKLASGRICLQEGP